MEVRVAVLRGGEGEVVVVLGEEAQGIRVVCIHMLYDTRLDRFCGCGWRRGGHDGGLVIVELDDGDVWRSRRRVGVERRNWL